MKKQTWIVFLVCQSDAATKVVDFTNIAPRNPKYFCSRLIDSKIYTRTASPMSEKMIGFYEISFWWVASSWVSSMNKEKLICYSSRQMEITTVWCVDFELLSSKKKWLVVEMSTHSIFIKCDNLKEKFIWHTENIL